MTTRIRATWARYGGVLLALVAAHAAITAALRLHGSVNALLFVPDAPIDLLIRMGEVRRWFDGIPIYDDPDSANYPPASYTLLWPVMGWLPEGSVRFLFACTTLVSIVAISWIGVRVSGARGRPAQAFIALLVLPLGATQITVWIGQLGLHVTACLMAAAALLFGTRPQPSADVDDGNRSWVVDLAAGCLLAASLVKPTLSVPVVATVLIGARHWRPWVLTGLLYLATTLVAAAAQDASPLRLIVQWLGREDVMQLALGSVNTHLWLHWLGVEGTLLAASFLWLLGLGAWAWRRRRADPWLLVALGALVGRLWIHHRAFDDVLLVIPLVVLCRVIATGLAKDDAAKVAAGVLIALIYGLGHAPYAWLSGETRALWLITEAGRTCAWLAALGFLVWYSHRSAMDTGSARAAPG